ncbi:MAG: family 43 glycosylhydrolase [Sedimentisphaerales bacterium]|nr:family 43 glycosylhydrolase [Sedimentisphaerales bacterium]
MKLIISMTLLLTSIGQTVDEQRSGTTLGTSGTEQTKLNRFAPGETWPDTLGKHIQAHGGGIILRDDTFYWYGEDRTPGAQTGVSCYSSKDLYNWKHEAVALPHSALPADIRDETFIERPKVIFNPSTGKYVMWMHLEQTGYHFARAGIALGNKPEGPFTFLNHMRPVQYDFGYKDNDPDRQKEFGGTYRDMNLFVDDDGRAYTFYASEHNATMYIVRLNEEFTAPETPIVENKTWARAFIGKYREAPAPFKFKDRYYIISSGCTGWKPNAAEYAVAENILGPWQTKGNPCIGEEAELTFRSQSTFVLPVPGKPGCYIFMADRWTPRRLFDSRYIWLPFIIGADGTFTIEWLDNWDLSYFDKKQ